MSNFIKRRKNLHLIIRVDVFQNYTEEYGMEKMTDGGFWSDGVRSIAHNVGIMSDGVTALARSSQGCHGGLDPPSKLIELRNDGVCSIAVDVGRMNYGVTGSQIDYRCG